MPKAATPLVSPDCGTFQSTGFHLSDLDQLKHLVRNAVLNFKENPELKHLPEYFLCSHCGLIHGLTPEEIHNALFTGPGAIDLAATFDEFKAILDGAPVAAAGVDLNNATSVSTDETFSNMIKPVTETAPVTPAPELGDDNGSDN